jgi:hypothetical protein
MQPANKEMVRKLVLKRPKIFFKIGKDGVKFFLCSGGVMFFNDCLDNGLLDCWLIFSGVVCCVWLKIINMKTQDIIIFYGVGNGVVV